MLATHYSLATVGLCLSLTNYSLIPQEMMACGLPCVDLAGGSSEAEFGRNGPLELAETDPVAVADAVEALLADRERRERRSTAGLRFAASATWDASGRQVEEALRQALAERRPSWRARPPPEAPKTRPGWPAPPRRPTPGGAGRAGASRPRAR